MTNLNEARGIIYEAFAAGVGVTPFTFDNENYDPPTDASWYRLVVRHDSRQQESLGGLNHRKFDSGGSVIVQCFAPLDTGAALADTLAETARNVFEGKTISQIRFTGADVREIGPTEDWYQINIEATFNYTETK